MVVQQSIVVLVVSETPVAERSQSVMVPVFQPMLQSVPVFLVERLSRHLFAAHCPIFVQSPVEVDFSSICCNKTNSIKLAKCMQHSVRCESAEHVLQQNVSVPCLFDGKLK